MPSNAYTGRVCSLAVAVGVGAAVVSGWGSGLAWADDSPGSAGSNVSRNEAGPSGATKRGSADDADSHDATTATSAAVSGTDVPNPEDGALRSALPRVVIGTGGFRRHAWGPTITSPDAGETAATSRSNDDDGSPSTPARPKGSDRRAAKATSTRGPAPVSAVADTKHLATLPVAPAAEQTTDAVHRLADVVTDPIERTGGAALLRTASTQSKEVATKPAVPSPHVGGVVRRLVSGVVNAVLSPFAASGTPRAPADAPSMWALLAFARREFESAVRSVASAPATVQTTGQTLLANTGGQPEQRTLILSAFPAEADAVLARTTLDPNASVVVDGHHFYLGTLGGEKVVVAMTGIGMVNATQTTEVALDHFTPESGISIGAVVFSGVAGGSGRTEIGDVAVPARWTSDDGETWHAVDPGMLAAANALTVDLDSTDSIGDPACHFCGPLAHLPLIDLNREPQLFVGGDGSSDDNNNGTAFPAIPFGGAIFGPAPFAAPDYSPLFTGNFFQAVVPFLAFGLLSNLTGLFAAVNPPVDAVDQETAAAQQVADAHGIPFLGIRGMSDGPGDPLNLPGYPFTFFVYKQIAADNAAIVTEAFLASWPDA